MIERTYDAHYQSNRKVHNLDVQLLSSSRPELLKKTFESFQKCVFTHAKLRFLIHEDTLNHGKSIDVLNYITDEMDAVVKTHIHGVPLGPAKVMDFMQERWNTEYIFHLQDDWEFELPVDLDRILWTMDNFRSIKCIFFNKRGNDNIGDSVFCEQTTFEPKEIDFAGLKVCTSYFWPFLPGIWRVSEFKKYWQQFGEKPEANFNKRIQKLEQISGLENLIKAAHLDKLGIYSLGHKNHPRYVRHLGENYSTLPWKSRPWKEHKILYSASDLRYRAPWLPEVEELP